MMRAPAAPAHSVCAMLRAVAAHRTTDTSRGAILFLTGPSASFVTGVILPVDGGWSAA
jgi:NAD(P)-dependent dehydrogenase (short-subunit alcohol dehydrogenase family)